MVIYYGASGGFWMASANPQKLNGKVEIYSIGTTIGSHTGPGTVALFFWGKERIN